jgi:hypothetical protein
MAQVFLDRQVKVDLVNLKFESHLMKRKKMTPVKWEVRSSKPPYCDHSARDYITQGQYVILLARIHVIPWVVVESEMSRRNTPEHQ